MKRRITEVTIVVLGILIAVLTNIATGVLPDMLPADWKQYLWLSWVPLVIFVLLVVILEWRSPRDRMPIGSDTETSLVDKIGKDRVSGDLVMGDKRSINTGGGDYAQGNIDKRQGTFIENGAVLMGAERSSEDSDRALLQELKEELPASGIMNFLKEQSFDDSYNIRRLRDLINFVENWNTVEHEFLDGEIEEKKRALYTTAALLLREIQTNTYQLNDDIYSIKKSRRHEEPERYKKEVTAMNGLADSVCHQYDDLIRTARNKLRV